MNLLKEQVLAAPFVSCPLPNEKEMEIFFYANKVNGIDMCKWHFILSYHLHNDLRLRKKENHHLCRYLQSFFLSIRNWQWRIEIDDRRKESKKADTHSTATLREKTVWMKWIVIKCALQSTEWNGVEKENKQTKCISALLSMQSVWHERIYRAAYVFKTQII